jgi:hypothetical protein
MWVFEEEVGGRKLTEIINTDHENVKYLPGHKLPVNVVAGVCPGARGRRCLGRVVSARCACVRLCGPPWHPRPSPKPWPTCRCRCATNL